MLFERGAKIIQWKKIVFSAKGTEVTGQTYAKVM
jgi:hypothetical protein